MRGETLLPNNTFGLYYGVGDPIIYNSNKPLIPDLFMLCRKTPPNPAPTKSWRVSKIPQISPKLFPLMDKLLWAFLAMTNVTQSTVMMDPPWHPF